MQFQQKSLMSEITNLKNDAKKVRYDALNAYTDFSNLK
jgi:hypothetical protein